jgi:hypothetical protein
MDHDKEKPLPRPARYARNAAFAALPLGLLTGLMLSSGQDAAGSGLGFAIGVVIGLAASAFFGFWYWILKSLKRTRLTLQFGWTPVLVAAIWFTVDTLTPQRYTLSVLNAANENLTELEVHIAGLEIVVGELKAGAEALTEGLEVPPESALTVSWVGAAGRHQSVSVESRDPPFYRHDGGELVIYIYPKNEVTVFFSWPDRILPRRRRAD